MKYTYKMLEKDVDKLVKEINATHKEFKNIFAIPRNGLLLGIRLSYKLGIPMIFDPIKISSKTIIVDTIIDSGRTLQTYKNYFVVCVWKKSHSSFIPTIYLRTANEWIDCDWEVGETEVQETKKRC